MKRPTNLHADSGREGGGFLSAGPSEIRTESDAVIEIRTRATDESDAARVAQERFVRPLTAALMVITEQPAYVELIRAAPETAAGHVDDQGWTAWSDFGFMSNVGAMPWMDEFERDRTIRIMQTIHHDKVAGASAVDLVEGVKMLWTTGGRQAEIEGAVLRHFLVIERIATRLGASRPPDPAQEEAQQRVIAELTRNLAKQTLSQAIRRVRNAAKALENAQTQRLARDIEYACNELALGDDVRTAALNLNDLRNQSLAHPGRPQAHHLLADSATLATNTAQAFLSGYASWRASPGG